MRTTAPLLLALVLSSCATVSVDGYSLNEGIWRTDERDIRSRASFELSCPTESLKLQVLTPYSGSDSYAGQVGVTGCDKKVVYVRAYGSGWVANSTSGEQAPK